MLHRTQHHPQTLLLLHGYPYIPLTFMFSLTRSIHAFPCTLRKRPCPNDVLYLSPLLDLTHLFTHVRFPFSLVVVLPVPHITLATDT